MRMILATLLVILVPNCCFGGSIAEQFAIGFGGVPWGTSLASLAGTMPGGEHFYATSAGERVYLVQNDAPLLGVPRQGHRVQYFLGKNGEVVSVGVSLPYERRDQFLGALISSFGAFASRRDVGISTVYLWQTDAGIRIALWASRNPEQGILSFIIHGPNEPPPLQPCRHAPAS